MTDKQILEFYEWEIECEHPFEIRHKDGSFASQQAADYVVYCLKQEYIISEYDTLMERIQKLKGYGEMLNDLTNQFKNRL